MRNILLLVIAILCSVMVLPSKASPFDEPIVSGVVLDEETRSPVAGAYVLAAYTDSGGTLFGHSSSWCIRTRGVTTGSDGRFSFRGRLGGGPDLYVIKEDYRESTTASRQYVGKKWHEPQGQQSVTLFLSRIKPDDQPSRYVSCWRANSESDIAAEKVYLAMREQEEAKHFSHRRPKPLVIKRSVVVHHSTAPQGVARLPASAEAKKEP